MQQLTPKETGLLKSLEATIEKTKDSFVACGKALEAIRDSKLYRDQYPSFDYYCRDRWGWGRAHAYRLIAASKVSPIGDTASAHSEGVKKKLRPKSESHARVLASVPEEERPAVLEEAQKNGKLTAKSIEQAAKKLKVITRIIVDSLGYPVPEKAMPYWQRKHEPEELLALITKARNMAKELQDAQAGVKGKQPDKLYNEVNMNTVYSDLCHAWQSFHLAVPYAVCTNCQGQAPETCTMCTGRGVISKFRFERTTPIEIKEMRMKQVRA